MLDPAAGSSPAFGRRPCVDVLGHPTTTFVIVVIFVIALLKLGQPLDAVSAVVVTLLLAVTRTLRPAVRPPAGPVRG